MVPPAKKGTYQLDFPSISSHDPIVIHNRKIYKPMIAKSSKIFLVKFIKNNFSSILYDY